MAQRGLSTLQMLCFVLTVCVGIPGVLELLWHMPNAVTRSGEAGTFVAAKSHEGGLLVGTITDVQSSTGSITVVGAFSGLRGQALFMRDSTKYGMQLCTRTHVENCAQLASTWTGPMRQIPHARRWFNIDFAGMGLDGGQLRFMMTVGLFAAFFGRVLPR